MKTIRCILRELASMEPGALVSWLCAAVIALCALGACMYSVVLLLL